MGSPLRVLHVVVNMNRGGAETLIMNLYRNIDRTKVQFDFLTCKEGAFDSEIEELGGRIHRIPYVTEVGHFGYVKVLKSFFNQHSYYKIVHSHMDKMSGLVLREAKKANVAVRIAHSHNTSSEGGISTKLYKSISGSYINGNATHLFACSKEAGKWLFGDQLQNTTILKNGIEPLKFQYSESIRNSLREELDLSKDTLVIGHVGRFNHQKNHVFLIDIFSNLKEKHPNSFLLLVGDGILKSEIKRKVDSLGLSDSVIFLGIRDDIHKLLHAFDVFVFPSLHEGLPVTLVEAQGAGLPCVISDNITSEVDMGLGLIQHLPFNDKNQWVENILKSYPCKRVIALEALSSNGYDIKNTAHNIEASYISFTG